MAGILLWLIRGPGEQNGTTAMTRPSRWLVFSFLALTALQNSLCDPGHIEQQRSDVAASIGKLQDVSGAFRCPHLYEAESGRNEVGVGTNGLSVRCVLHDFF